MFKIGDFVKLTNNSFTEYYSENIPRELIKHGNTTLRNPEYSDKGCEIMYIQGEYYIVKVPTFLSCNQDLPNYTQIGFRENKLILFCEKINKIEKIMSNILEFAKNLVLSEDEKLLRKYNLKDSCGNYTSDAKELVVQKLMKDNEQVLIDTATALQAEEDKNK